MNVRRIVASFRPEPSEAYSFGGPVPFRSLAAGTNRGPRTYGEFYPPGIDYPAQGTVAKKRSSPSPSFRPRKKTRFRQVPIPELLV